MAQHIDPLHSNSKKALSATITAICAGVPLAQAQDADEGSLKLEEVIVTATKRGALSLQDVPMSITAFTDETIRSQGFKTLDALTPALVCLISVFLSWVTPVRKSVSTTPLQRGCGGRRRARPALEPLTRVRGRA